MSCHQADPLGFPVFLRGLLAEARSKTVDGGGLLVTSGESYCCWSAQSTLPESDTQLQHWRALVRWLFTHSDRPEPIQCQGWPVLPSSCGSYPHHLSSSCATNRQPGVNQTQENLLRLDSVVSRAKGKGIENRFGARRLLANEKEVHNIANDQVYFPNQII